MTMSRSHVRELINAHRPALDALAHFDGCAQCQEEGPDTCPELEAIFEQEGSDG